MAAEGGRGSKGPRQEPTKEVAQEKKAGGGAGRGGAGRGGAGRGGAGGGGAGGAGDVLEIGVGSQGAAEEMDPDAEQPSMEPTVSGEEAEKRNYKIKPYRGSDRETSVERLRLPLSQTQLSELAAAIRAGFSAGQQSGQRASCIWKEPVTGAVYTAKGYRSYGAVNGKHAPAKQFKATCVLTPEARLWEYCLVLPQLSHILAFVRLHAPGRAIAFVHLLDQSSEQAQFTWHVDNNPKDAGYGQIELSFVFCITDTDSSMQVAGRAAFQYAGAGSGCMFSAGLWHASVHAAPGTLKVAVFLCK